MWWNVKLNTKRLVVLASFGLKGFHRALYWVSSDIAVAYKLLDNLQNVGLQNCQGQLHKEHLLSVSHYLSRGRAKGRRPCTRRLTRVSKKCFWFTASLSKSSDYFTNTCALRSDKIAWWNIIGK